MQWLDIENRDGIRFSWNILPSSRLDAVRMSVPVGCLYSPLKSVGENGVGTLPYKPIFCSTQSCGGILNPYCKVDFHNKIFVCPFCLGRNHFPHHYAEISMENRPGEIMPQYTTIEYILDNPPVAKAPVFLYVIDTCMIDEELQALKSAILQSLFNIPENSLVGLISFGKNIHVHELTFEDCLKSYVFRGDKETDAATLASMLGIRRVQPQGGQQQQGGSVADAAFNRFLSPVSEVDIDSLIKELAKDPWPVKPVERAERCTGAAVQVAVSLLETCCKNQNGRVMLFVGGPTTIGPGKIITTNLKETLRSQQDIQRSEAALFKDATKFYATLGDRAALNGHTIDIFACALDQVGVAEMRPAVDRTGGHIVMDDSFTHNIFSGSFQRIFFRDEADNNDLIMAFAAEMQVLTSRELTCCGAIGAVQSLNRKSNSVSETEIGVGNTCAWRLGGVDHNATVGLYFEMVNNQANQQANAQQQQQAYIQIATKYRHSSGRTHLRVTTVAKPIYDFKNAQGFQYIKAGFDQEAAAVLMARWAVQKTETEYTFDILRWLDHKLIKLVARFATYQKGDPELKSFNLSPEFKFYPGFMFHLRRSQFLQTFNSSPDESAFYRMICLKENCVNTVVMIQPTLTSYTTNGPATPVTLDVSSIDPQRILVLDTFFHIVLWYGENIHKWILDKVHEKEGYEFFAEFLKAPKLEVKQLMERRLPTPRFIECVHNDSQSRFIMAKLNPSSTHKDVKEMGGGGEPPVFTEDVSLKVFFQHLKRLAVMEE